MGIGCLLGFVMYVCFAGVFIMPTVIDSLNERTKWIGSLIGIILLVGGFILLGVLLKMQ